MVGWSGAEVAVHSLCPGLKCTHCACVDMGVAMAEVAVIARRVLRSSSQHAWCKFACLHVAEGIAMNQ